MTLTRSRIAAVELAAFCAALRWPEVPAEARERTKELVLDLVGVGRDPLVADSEPLGLQVAHDRCHPVCVPLAHQRVELRLRPLADEHEDLTLTAVDELLDEVPADEPGRTRDEVGHARGA